MHSSELRKLIRDAIAAELSGRDAGPSGHADGMREEIVSIGSDDELSAFVRRLLDMADDPTSRANLRSGRLTFKLAAVASHRPPDVSQAQPAPIAPRFVTERWVDGLPEGTKMVTLGKRTRLTPLAKDRLRAKNIKIERAVT